MAENMAPAAANHTPNGKFSNVYGQWADGGWGMLLTGMETIFYIPKSLNPNGRNSNQGTTGNVQVSETYLGQPKDVAIMPHTSKIISTITQEEWKTWASTCQRSGTPTIVQLNHPGRQSPAGVGNRSIFSKAIAPSAVKLNFGPSLLAKTASALLFGTPREMTVQEICGEGGLVDQFVEAAKQSFDAGFKGVELHAA